MKQKANKPESLTQLPEQPSFDVDEKKNVKNKIKDKSKSMPKFKSSIYQNIIDYPRHIRISNQYESVAKVQNDLRRQRVFHSEFQPALMSTKNQVILEGVYKPNEPISREHASQFVNEFIRERGNLKTEPVVQPKRDVIKILGDPKIEPIPWEKRKKQYGIDGHILTVKEIEQKKQSLRLMHDYPKHIVIENRTEKGKEEVTLKMSEAKQRVIDDLVYKNMSMMTSNVGKCLVAKQRYIMNQLDEGFEMEVPAKHKWHPSQHKSKDFLSKLNTSSICLLN